MPAAAPAGAERFRMPGVKHVYQKWNNCGPSTVVMALSPFGLKLDQLAVAAILKPNSRDTNVSPEEMAAFIRTQGLRAQVKVNGDQALVKRLLEAGVPVIVEQWIDVEGRGEMGHYRVVIGFDEPLGQFITNDSYYGPARRIALSDFDKMWKPFGNVYVVAYRPSQTAAVQAAIGADWDDAAMWARAKDTFQAAVDANPEDGWRWFALGEALSHVGDYAGAVKAFERAPALGLPMRTLWYQFGYYRALYETGAYGRLVEATDHTLASMNGLQLEESHYWRGMALRRLGLEDDARKSFEKALSFHAGFALAKGALAGE